MAPAEVHLSQAEAKTGTDRDDHSPTTQSIVPLHYLDLNRERLFPADVAREQGLDPDNFAMVEIPNGSSSLYNALLLYAAHYAVDLDEPLPPQTGERDGENDPPRDKAPPTDADVVNSKESNSASDDIAKQVKGNTVSSPEPCKEKEKRTVLTFIRGLNGVPVPLREGSGRLSSLWNCPEDRCNPFAFSDSDSDSDSDSGSDSGSDSDSDSGERSDCEDSDRDGDGRGSNGDGDGDGDDVSATSDEKSKEESGSTRTTMSGVVSIGALKKKAEPPVQRYQMGIGYAKIRVGEHIVYMNHVAYGLPVSESCSIQVFRTLVLAGAQSFQLQELCALALKWRSDREQQNQRARPGRFSLFRWKTSMGESGDWINQGYKRSRPPRSIILPEGQLAAIVKDIKDFVARDTKAWYEDHGLPHRRSFLFHGPPGCGKTSTIKMIAGMFRLNACFLSLTASNFSNQLLHDALTSMPRRALLVIEDVDVLFNEDRKSEGSQSLTFSGMLNAMDGLISVDGILTIFTTNHIEKLDPALIRGGRVDRRFEFVHPNAKQLAALFKSFYDQASDALADRFAEIVMQRPEEEARSIATLQQHFIYTRKASAEESVKLVPEFFAEFYPKGIKSRPLLYI